MADKGISVDGEGGGTVSNCVLTSNETGVAVKDKSDVLLVNNTIVKNASYGVHVFEKVAGQGGGAAELINNIVWRNGVSVETDALSQVQISHCLIEGGAEGEAILDEDPLFLDWESGDYLLAENSPCIDAGTSENAPLWTRQTPPAPKAMDTTSAPTSGGCYTGFELETVWSMIFSSMGDWVDDGPSCLSGIRFVWLYI